ncbi:MAG: hypothetical protein ABIY37_17115 [Devosia sp.]
MNRLDWVWSNGDAATDHLAKTVFEPEPVHVATGLLDRHGRKLFKLMPSRAPVGFVRHDLPNGGVLAR